MSKCKIVTLRFYTDKLRDRRAWENLKSMKNMGQRTYNDVIMDMLAEQRWEIGRGEAEDLAVLMCMTVKKEIREYLSSCQLPLLASNYGTKGNEELDPDVDWDYLNGF